VTGVQTCALPILCYLLDNDYIKYNKKSIHGLKTNDIFNTMKDTIEYFNKNNHFPLSNIKCLDLPLPSINELETHLNLNGCYVLTEKTKKIFRDQKLQKELNDIKKLEERRKTKKKKKQAPDLEYSFDTIEDKNIKGRKTDYRFY
jgi:hypothetical protein